MGAARPLSARAVDLTQLSIVVVVVVVVIFT